MQASARCHSRDRVAHRGLLALTIVLTTLTAGCARQGAPASACRGGETAEVADTLYFGTAMPVGRVATRDWDTFLAASEFAGGLTHWTASGLWTSPHGRGTEEETHVVQIVHPDTDAMNRLIIDLMMRYRAQFRQQAVLRVRAPVCASGSNQD